MALILHGLLYSTVENFPPKKKNYWNNRQILCYTTYTTNLSSLKYKTLNLITKVKNAAAKSFLTCEVRLMYINLNRQSNISCVHDNFIYCMHWAFSSTLKVINIRLCT